jgi:hypothetical protein
MKVELAAAKRPRETRQADNEGHPFEACGRIDRIRTVDFDERLRRRRRQP